MDGRHPEKKVFILENGEYIEITYEELCRRTEENTSYKGKFFLPLHGMLMEVTEVCYKEFYKAKRRQKYLDERSKENGDFSYDMLTTDEFSGEEILVDPGESVADQVERRILLDKLKQAMGALSDAEQLLIYRHYFAGMSETELAAIYGISQQAVSKRIRSARGKLKKFLEK